MRRDPVMPGIPRAAGRIPGMSFADVVKTRIYMLNTAKWADAGRAHAEILGNVRPALSFIGVSNFYDPLIELEVEVVAMASAKS